MLAWSVTPPPITLKQAKGSPLKHLFILTAALAAIGTAAAAQPAYDPAQGGAPDQYPTCDHKDQDRCMQPMGGMGGHHHHHHHHMAKGMAMPAKGERG